MSAAQIGRPVSCRINSAAETLVITAEQDDRRTAWVVVSRWTAGAREPQVLWRLRPNEADEMAEGLRRVLRGIQGRP
jgi:hypothetical protein